ncbi:hypothetical protein C3486_13720 [Streptomyces sp. Ru73]|uniref:hypothetical protein n=1 Tax=Streptomyces sp. Ru73 TaxID=2080748 RepID=UPI000CDDFDE0|nr:hypothetical protein [Streptomyces sp. Ru73]POX40400.1 hypothetical protein C3486_13720 [Streptomyces sp. Ru73]
MGATGRAHRSAAWTLLVLLAVVFAPLLCRTGGVPGVSGAPAATAPGHPAVAATAPSAAVEPAPVAAAVPKKCSPHDAPGSGDTVPAPATHRGEPLAAPAAVPAPYLSHDPARCALARPPTGPAAATDPRALLTVLRI